MRDDLYFLHLIAAAWQQSSSSQALVTAFADIRCCSQQDRYKRGYRQFERWMEAIATYRKHQATEGGATSPHTSGRQQSTVTLRLFREKHLIAELALIRAGEHAVVDHIRPGLHRLVLETGRVVWAHWLTEADLFPERHIPMAANDGRELSQPARTFRASVAGLTIQLNPRLGGGQFLISWSPKEESP